MKLGIAHSSCYLVAVVLGKLGSNQDNSYQRFLETANYLLGNVLNYSIILIEKLGFMVLSTANTSPANP